MVDSIKERLEWYEDLEPKIQVVEKLAEIYADAFVSLDHIFKEYAEKGYKGVDIALDSVHPTAIGHGLIAKEYLEILHRVIFKLI